MIHDPMSDSILIRLPADHPVMPAGVVAIVPNNGRSSVENAETMYPGCTILCWERSGDPYIVPEPEPEPEEKKEKEPEKKEKK